MPPGRVLVRPAALAGLAGQRVPLGLAAVKFWTREKFKGTAALKKKINPTRVPIEGKESIRWLENLRQSTALFGDPARCIHIGDRESDIYELFCTAAELGTAVPVVGTTGTAVGVVVTGTTCRE